MATLTKASAQWASRAPDERFTSLTALAAKCNYQRQHSAQKTVANRKISVAPENGTVRIYGPNGTGYEPTHWAFGQLAERVGAPARYLRSLAPELIADNLNYGLRFSREIEDLGVLLRREDVRNDLAAVTGPSYGRIWNTELADTLVDKFGDGLTGHWRQPGEFGKKVEITKKNCTLYASDHDMFVFLADEDRRIEVPDRRAGEPGSFARGFFVGNSEVGAATCFADFFLFDYACCNRIVWGARDVVSVRIRHTAGAPSRWIEQVLPALDSYSKASAAPIIEAIAEAKRQKIQDDLDSFLAARFTKNLVEPIKAAFEADENRPIETRWDVVTGATAYARTIEHQDYRVKIERTAGDLLRIAA